MATHASAGNPFLILHLLRLLLVLLLSLLLLSHNLHRLVLVLLLLFLLMCSLQASHHDGPSHKCGSMRAVNPGLPGPEPFVTICTTSKLLLLTLSLLLFLLLLLLLLLSSLPQLCLFIGIQADEVLPSATPLAPTHASGTDIFLAGFFLACATAHRTWLLLRVCCSLLLRFLLFSLSLFFRYFFFFSCFLHDHLLRRQFHVCR